MSGVTSETLRELLYDREFDYAVIEETAEESICPSCPIGDLPSSDILDAVSVAMQEEDYASKNMGRDEIRNYAIANRCVVAAIQNCLDIRRSGECSSGELDLYPTLLEGDNKYADQEFVAQGQLAVDLGLE